MIDIKHMDIASRNHRLRETLEGMGLFVLPIFCESEQDRIDYMQVSVALPTRIEQGRESATSGPVSTPVTSSKVAEGIKTTDTGGGSVVNFPSKR
jgi:hypothetical protein